MVERVQVPNNISLKVNSSGSKKGQKNSSFPFDTDKYPKELSEAYTTVTSMLKIVMIGCLSECSSFFAEYSNYEKLAKTLSKMKLFSENNITPQTAFSKAPMNSWCDITLAMFSSLFAMPNGGGIHCVRLFTPADGREFKRENSHGVVLKYMTVLEAYDWKEHEISMFVPDDQTRYRSVVLMDNNPIVITNKNASE